MNAKGLREMLIKHEGLRLTVYDDATGDAIRLGTTVQGIATIGGGRNLVERGLTPEEAHYLLDHDIARTLDELYRMFPVVERVNAVRAQVLANMLFNLGASRLQGFERMLDALEAGDYRRAAKEMLDSRWASQVGRRATELAHAMRTGTFGR